MASKTLHNADSYHDSQLAYHFTVWLDDKVKKVFKFSIKC